MYLATNDILNKLASFNLNGVTAEMHQRFEAGIAQDSAENNRVLSASGDVATINISGVLTKSYTFMTWLMGGTSYDDISAAIELAESDKEINRIEIKMNSGGGYVSGLFDLIAKMQVMKKPIDCIISGVCASAAYAIASQCDTITAISEGESIGSIGIVTEAYIDENTVSITSSNAPKKRYDAQTEDGIEGIRAELDDYEELFIEAIASGRNTTVKAIIKDYGQGATMTARKALSVGMIDKIQSTILTKRQGVPDQSKTATKEESYMNIAELQANHPELYAQAVEIGKTAEQDRVSAFVALGDASGAKDLAMKCIKDGTDHSATTTALFQAEQMAQMKLQALASDNPDTIDIDNPELEDQGKVSATEKAAQELKAEMEANHV